MSDTPRTDAVRIGPQHTHKYWEDFARELERENAQLAATARWAIAERDRAEQEKRDNESAYQIGRDKFLAEISALRKEISALANPSP